MRTSVIASTTLHVAVWGSVAALIYLWWAAPSSVPGARLPSGTAPTPLDPSPSAARRVTSWKSDQPNGDGELVIKWDGALVPVGAEMIALGKWLGQDALQSPRRDLVLVVEGELTDRYGARTTVPVLILRWPSADWRRVAWETITPSLVIDLATPVLVHPAIRDAVASWCATLSLARSSMCRRDR